MDIFVRMNQNTSLIFELIYIVRLVIRCIEFLDLNDVFALNQGFDV